MNLCTVKWAQWDKTQSRELLGLFICVCIALCTIVAHNIAQNRPDNFPSYPPDNHHGSDDVYFREGGDIKLLYLAIHTVAAICHIASDFYFLAWQEHAWMTILVRKYEGAIFGLAWYYLYNNFLS